MTKSELIAQLAARHSQFSVADIELSVKAKDMAEETEAMKQLRTENAASAAGSTNLGALLRAKLDNRNQPQ